MNTYNTQKGLTLVEVLIAVTLSILLLNGVIQIFTSTKQSYRIQDALSRIQENGRFGVQILSSDIQMAGFRGCNGGDEFTNKLNSSTSLQYNFDETIEGYNDISSSTPTYLSNAGITPDAGTDLIIIRRPDAEPFRSTLPTTDTTVNMEVASVIDGACTGSVDQVNAFCPGDFMMISDCEKSIVFQSGTITVSGTSPNQIATITHPSSGTPGNADANWGGNGAIHELFDADANTEIYKLSTVAYFVDTVDGIPSLFRFKDGSIEALVEGVEDLQIQYGEDTSGDGVANIYRDANTVSTWDSVVSAQMNLLIRSKDNNMSADTLGYIFNGTTIAADDMATSDYYIRREFTTTITMRNHAS